jgi:hypothetical protein
MGGANGKNKSKKSKTFGRERLRKVIFGKPGI